MKQDSLLLNYEYLKRCNLATVSKTDDKVVLRGVCIQERQENGNYYRYYIGCDGSILVGYKEKIAKCMNKEIILNMNDFKIHKDNEKKIIDNGGYLLFERDTNYRYKTDFGNIFIIDGIYPNYMQLFAKKFKVADEFVQISFEKHKILNQFWKTNDRVIKLCERTFFINTDVKDETTAPLFNFQKINDKVLKFSLCMPIRAYIDFDLKDLKQFDF